MNSFRPVVAYLLTVTVDDLPSQFLAWLPSLPAGYAPTQEVVLKAASPIHLNAAAKYELANGRLQGPRGASLSVRMAVQQGLAVVLSADDLSREDVTDLRVRLYLMWGETEFHGRGASEWTKEQVLSVLLGLEAAPLPAPAPRPEPPASPGAPGAAQPCEQELNYLRPLDCLEFADAYGKAFCFAVPRETVDAWLKQLSERIGKLRTAGQQVPSGLLAAYRGYEVGLLMRDGLPKPGESNANKQVLIQVFRLNEEREA